MQQLRERLQEGLGSSYTIERELDGGGMARLFVAEETSLGRKVVVKVLPPDSVSPDSVARFNREARLAAGLQHPNIVPVLASGAFDDLRYYTMPLIEGESLRQRIARDGPLPHGDVLAITRGMADALDHAHKSGIVHRDVKPENVMLSRGQALVTDFGIAQAVAREASITQTGMSVGTPAYMSPEQFYADSIVDARADVYAMGCVVYEMLTGESPCGNARSAMEVARQLLEPPPRSSARRAGLSSSVDDALSRARAREANDRYASAAELYGAVRDALGPPAATAPLGAQRAIAVLPFRSLSPDPDDEFFATGLADEITTDLGRLRGLRVTARASSARYKGSTKDSRNIARELGVQFLLEGSVRRAGQSLRVIAELVDAERDAQVWSERYSGTLEDVFEIQEGIAREIVKALELRLSSEDDRRLAHRSIENVQAYELYLRARQMNLSFSEAGVRKGLDLVNTALELEPDSPPLLALKGLLIWNTHNLGFAGREALAAASQWAERALRTDPDLGQALVVRAMLECHNDSVDSGLVLRLLKRAADTDPSSESLLWLPVMMAQTGHSRLAVPYANRAFQLDPFNTTVGCATALVLVLDGSVAEGLARATAAIARDSTDHVMRTYTAMLYAMSGDFDTALRELQLSQPDGFIRTLRDIYLASLTGQSEEVARLMDDDIVHSLFVMDDQYAWIGAGALAHAGHLDRAMAMLRTAMERGFCASAFVRDRDHMLAPLRSHPEFATLLRRMDERAAQIAVEASL